MSAASASSLSPSAVFLEHEGWLRTVVSSRLGETDAVDDVMQNIAMAIVRQKAALSGVQRVGAWHGVAYFNDSKSTTPGATMRALEAFEDLGRVHLIAGGYDKHIDLSGIAGLAPRLAGLYAIGQVQEQLAASGGLCCGTMETAVHEALRRARPGDSILLSPACASLDQYPNFEHRGDHFVALVRTAAAAASR